MKNLFKSLLLATALIFSAPVVHLATASHAPVPAACAITEDQFLASARNMNAKIRVAEDHARVAIINNINDARLKANMWALEADNLMIGIIQDKGQLLVGIVMYKDHCVVPGTVKVFPAQDFVAFLVELGLSMDDFTPIAGT
jgi:hypothetical protein